MKLFLIAGEPSGDKLGASLMARLKETHPDVQFEGVGGPLMEAEGLNSLFDMADLSVMGLVEVLPRIPTLLKRIRQTIEYCLTSQAEALITIDSPDFCLRVAAKVRDQQPRMKIIHYVAPSVWAWRPERAEKMARHVDHVLALLPFEPPYMEAAGMTCDFVGHPIVSEPVATDVQIAQLRNDLGIDGRIVTLLPGSRKGEISRLAPIFGAVAAQIKSQQPDISYVLPTIKSALPLVQKLTSTWAIQPTIVCLDEPQKRALFGTSLCALSASGTVSLELAAAGCPHVVAYKANWATTRMVKKLAKIDTASLVSILDESKIVPEHLFDACTVDQITPSVLHLLKNPTAQQAQKDGFKRAMKLLGRGQDGLEMRAAQSVLAQLQATA